MIFENEELRLRTININAEVERGQSDIRKLRRENDQLRREIWCLRDEYDRLDKLLRQNLKEGGKNVSDSEDSGESCDTCGAEDDEAIEEEEEADEAQEGVETTENEQNNLKANLHVKFDHLSIVSEENLACSGSSSSHTSPLHQSAFSALSPPETPDLPKIHDLQSVGPPLSHFENIFSSIPYEDIEKCIEKPGTETAIPRLEVPLQSASSEGRKSPNVPRNFQSGGNLEDLLQDIEVLSQGILQMQNQTKEGAPSANPETPKMTKYRSEVNLVLSTGGQETEEAQKPDIILMQSEIKPPEPMPILSALYPHQPERRSILQQQKAVSKDNSFDTNMILAHLPSISSHILTPKILNADDGPSSSGENRGKSTMVETQETQGASEGEKNKVSPFCSLYPWILY